MKIFYTTSAVAVSGTLMFSTPVCMDVYMVSIYQIIIRIVENDLLNL